MTCQFLTFYSHRGKYWYLFAAVFWHLLAHSVLYFHVFPNQHGCTFFIDSLWKNCYLPYLPVSKSNSRISRPSSLKAFNCNLNCLVKFQKKVILSSQEPIFRGLDLTKYIDTGQKMANGRYQTTDKDRQMCHRMPQYYGRVIPPVALS